MNILIAIGRVLRALRRAEKELFTGEQDRKLEKLITRIQNNRHNLTSGQRAKFDSIMRRAFT
jgi:hypothetical protein